QLLLPVKNINHTTYLQAHTSFLKMEKIPLIASDLEDTCPRKVAYFPRTGIVRMKRLVNVDSQKIGKREQQYKAQFSQSPIAGEVELFG
ncbi:MAG: hypothetical protein EOO22_03805, partial [Comamonadaceae bacterium]